MRALLVLAFVLVGWPAFAQTCETPCALPASSALFVELDAVPGVTAYTLRMNGLPLPVAPMIVNGVVSFPLPQGLTAGTWLFDVRSPTAALTEPTPLIVCEANTWAANYYPNATLTGFPAVAGCETLINHAWGVTGPPGLGADNFSARYAGRFTFAAAPSPVTPTPASYLFTARTDDGMRAWVDADPILDSWHDQGATTYTATRSLMGSHALRVEYYEHGGEATAVFGWQLAPVTIPITSWSCTVSQQVGTYSGGDKRATLRCPATFTPGRGDAVKVTK
jgi:PA14 domain